MDNTNTMMIILVVIAILFGTFIAVLVVNLIDNKKYIKALKSIEDLDNNLLKERANKITALEDQLKVTEDMDNDLLMECHALNDQKNNFDGFIVAQGEINKQKYNSLLEEYNNLLLETKEDKAVTDSTISSLTQENIDCWKTIASLRADNKKLETEVDRLNELISKRDEFNDELQESLEFKNETIDSLNKEVKSLKAQLEKKEVIYLRSKHVDAEGNHRKHSKSCSRRARTRGIPSVWDDLFEEEE